MSSTNRICSALTLTVLFASLALQASADTVFFDDFSDGSVTNDVPVDRDGNPVRWTEQPNSGDYNATSGDYVFTPTTTEETMRSGVVDITLEDFSIRTQVRTSGSSGGAFVQVRVQEPLVFPSSPGYFAGLEYRLNIDATILILGLRNDDDTLTFFGNDRSVPFDVRTEDAVLQLDVIGNELKLWAWKAGDPMPDQPQYTAIDSTYSEGTMRIVNGTTDNNNNITTFRYVHVADMHIPEPTTILLAMLGMASVCCLRRRR